MKLSLILLNKIQIDKSDKILVNVEIKLDVVSRLFGIIHH